MTVDREGSLPQSVTAVGHACTMSLEVVEGDRPGKLVCNRNHVALHLQQHPPGLWLLRSLAQAGRRIETAALEAV